LDGIREELIGLYASMQESTGELELPEPHGEWLDWVRRMLKLEDAGNARALVIRND